MTIENNQHGYTAEQLRDNFKELLEKKGKGDVPVAICNTIVIRACPECEKETKSKMFIPVPKQKKIIGVWICDPCKDGGCLTWKDRLTDEEIDEGRLRQFLNTKPNGRALE